jgi:hypothetical protein
MTDAQIIAALQQQVIYYRNQATALNQLLQSTRNTPERHHGKTTLWADPTGQKAVHNADKERKNRKAP